MTDKRRTLIFINILIVSIASSFLSTALSTALAPIIVEFGLDTDKGQWINSSYSLVMGKIMTLSAFLITRFNTKRLYVSSLAIMIIGLVSSSFATSFPSMMVGRLLQAISSSINTAMAQVVLLTIYPVEKRGSIMGWYGLSLSAAPIVAPTIGGLFVDTVGWRMVFVVTTIFMAVALVSSLFCFEDVMENRKDKFDISSFVLSVLAFGGISLALGNAGRMNYLFFVSLVLGISSGVLFVRRQNALTTPFLDVSVLKNRNFAISVASSCMLYMCMMGNSIIIPLFLQNTLGSSVTVSGLVTLPGSLVLTILNPFTGKLYDKYGMRRPAIVGALCVIVSYLGMSMVKMDTSYYYVALMHSAKCMGIAIMMMGFLSWGISSVEKEKTAHANALFNSLRMLSGGMGQVLFVSMISGVSSRIQGKEGGVFGVRIAFSSMVIVSMIQLLISFVFIKKTNLEDD